MSHELPMPPWVPSGYVVQTFLQKTITVRKTLELPSNASLDPTYAPEPIYLVPVSMWNPAQE